MALTDKRILAQKLGIPKTFNWDWLTVSEVQSIISMAGSMAVVQADMIMEKELRVLNLDLKAARRLFCRQLGEGSLMHWVEFEQMNLKTYPHSDTLPPTRPHPFQQSFTHCNKATPPNNATSWPRIYKPPYQGMVVTRE